jgi:hypothetical protein
MPLKSIHNQNLGFIEQKNVLLNTTEVQTIKNLLIDIIFAMKIFYNDLFRAAPYRLMLVLHKDALFHSKCDPLVFSAPLWDERIAAFRASGSICRKGLKLRPLNRFEKNGTCLFPEYNLRVEKNRWALWNSSWWHSLLWHLDLRANALCKDIEQNNTMHSGSQYMPPRITKLSMKI